MTLSETRTSKFVPYEIHFTLHVGLTTIIARRIISNLKICPNVRNMCKPANIRFVAQLTRVSAPLRSVHTMRFQCVVETRVNQHFYRICLVGSHYASEHANLIPTLAVKIHQFMCISINTHIPKQENGYAPLPYRGHAAVDACHIVVHFLNVQ